ncbi:MAG: hypothetical protein IH790_09020 [Acidobacteria bacterium]|nr:hypothetical protein [Acidobacteriota bacterium]
MGVVKERPAQPDHLRRRVEESHPVILGKQHGVDDRDRALELVEHVHAVVDLVDSDTGGPFADLDKPDAVEGGVDDDDVVGRQKRADRVARTLGVPECELEVGGIVENLTGQLELALICELAAQRLLSRRDRAAQ